MSATIYPFPPGRRPPAPPAAPPVRFVIRPYDDPEEFAFGALMAATLLLAGMYLSGAAGLARHDGLYAGLVATVWGAFYFWRRLWQSPVLGPRLARTLPRLGRAGGALCLAVLYWEVLGR